MMKNSLLLIALLISSTNLYSQTINVNPGGSPESSMTLEQLIENVFLGQSCASVTNITSISNSTVEYFDASFNTVNNQKSFAYFTNAGGNFPSPRGVIMSSGAATASQGANTIDAFSGMESAGTWPGDADIKTILDNRFGDNQPTNNATIVEFDFVPLDTNFSFDYVFASEEYQERNNSGTDYECSTFQDGFAFILSGPGVTNDAGIAGKNIALLADGVTPVSAGTIHNNAEVCAPAQNTGLHVAYATNATATNSPIQYNGRTILLTASHPVTAGQTYHMKMVIADRMDSSYDSAVFLQASSATAITADLGSDRVVCAGDFPQLLSPTGTYGGGASFSWLFNGNPIAGATGSTYNATQAGSYEVVVEEGSQCTSDTVVISTTPLPTASVSANGPICDGDNAIFTITGTPNAEVTYTIGSGTSQTITLDSTGTATVQENNVSANTTINITNVESFATTINGNGINATGGANPANSTGNILATGTVPNNTNSSLINNANQNLVLTLAHTVPVGTVITISISRDNNTGDLTITDGTASQNFNAGPNDVLQQITFTTGVATNILNFNRNGGGIWLDGVTYSYTIPGCTQSLNLSETVIVNPNPTIALTSNNPICDGDNAIFTITGTPGHQITYSGITGTPASPVTVGAGGTATITVNGASTNQTISLGTVTNLTTNCSTNLTDTNTVTVNPNPSVTLTSNNPICDGDDAIFTITGTAGHQITYSGVTGTPASPVTIGAGGTATVTVNAVSTNQTISLGTVTNLTTNCSTTLTDTNTVTVNPNPTITLNSNNPICDGDNAVFTITGTPGHQVTYSGVTGTPASPVTIGAGGTATITVNGASTNQTISLGIVTIPTTNCSTTLTDTNTVTVNPNPTVTLASNNPICSGSDATFTITGTPGHQVTYSGVTGTPTSPVTIGAGGTVAVTVNAASTDQTITLGSATNPTTNCSTSLTDTNTVTVNPNPTVTLTSNNPICSGSDATFTITGTAGDLVTYSGVIGVPASPITIGAGGITIVTINVPTSNQTITLNSVSNPTSTCSTNLTNTATVTLNQTPIITDLADQTHCNSYVLPAITGTNLTGNEQYYTATNGGGTAYTAGTTLNEADFATYPVTLYIYDATGTNPNCTHEQSFNLTIDVCNVSVVATTSNASICTADNTNVTLTATPNPAAAIGTYSYSWNEQGNTTVLGTNNTLVVNPTTTITYEVTITDSGLAAPNNTASNTVLVTVVDSPDITDLADQTHCDSYTLPAIIGTNLTGNEQYYTATNGGGTAYAVGTTLNHTDFATYPVTLYIYDATGTNPNCIDQEDFTLTLNQTPIIDDLIDQIHCDSYVLPTITGTNLTGNEQYYTATNGGGTGYTAGATLNYADFATYPVTLYIYDATGTNPNCTHEQNFTLTLNQTPIIADLADQTHCNSYVLPAITGTNLTGNEQYYTATNGGGTAYTAGTTLNEADFATYPVTLYIYDATGTNPNCTHEQSFNLTIDVCNVSVVATTSNASICTADNTNVTLTATPNPAAAIGTYSYSWNEQGNTTVLGTNNTLVVNPTTTITYEVTITDSGLAAPNNTASNTVLVTVVDSPDITDLADQTHCDSYTLPAIIGTNLTGNEQYYTATNGGGTAYAVGTTLNHTDFATYPVTLYIYDATGTNPNCIDQEDFTLTLNQTPIIDDLIDQIHCDSYVLPTITGTNLTGNEQYYTATNGGGTGYTAGAILNYADFATYPVNLYIYDATGTNPNCTHEQNFTLTLNQTPTFTVSSSNPTACSASDGSISVDGLNNNTTYNITYTDDGVITGPINLTSNGSGNITISGLNAGIYTNVTVELNNCTTTDSSITTLIDPNGPTFTNLTNNTDICAMADAVFTLVGTADTDVSYSYTIGAGAAVAGTVTLDNTGNGTVTIPTAQNTTSSIDVVLTLIDITNPVTTCSTVLTNVSTVTVNPNPEITNLTNNTDICAMDNAVFTLVGTADTDVSYSYTIGAGAAVAGTVTLDNTGNGTVTIATPQNTTTAIDVVITLINITNPVTTCSTTLTNTSTVTVNPNPEITSFTNNTDICAMADAVFTLVGTADTDVSYSYTVGAGTAVAGTVTLDNTGNGTVTIATPQNTTTAIDVVLTLNNIVNPLTTCSAALTNVSTVTVNPNPEVTNVTNNSDICAMEDAIFDITGTADTVVTYTIDGGAAQTITLDGTGAGQIVVTTVQNTAAAVNIVLTLSDITNPVTGCNTTLTNVSTIIVNPNPEAISVDMAPVCDDDLDGQMIFDLTTNINALTNNASGVTVTFYNSQADAEGLMNSLTTQGLDTSAYQIQAPAVLPTVQNVETIWVNIQNDTTGCDSVTSFTITVNTVMANGPVDLYACEQDNDGFAQFNLYDAVAFIGGNIPSMQVYFYATPGQAAAQIAGTEIGSGNSATVTDIFHSVVNTYDEPIYVVVVDTATGCSYNAEGIVMLNVIDAPELQTGAIDYTLCDYDGDETDNIAVFDLTSLNSQLFIDANTDLADYTVTYYSSLISEGGAADVLISNDTAYENVSDPQVIYAVVTANTVYGCSTIKEVTLLVDLPPVAEAFYSLTICDDDYYLGATDIPSHSFDLTSSESFITNETGNIFSYYLTNADASAATNAITNTTDFENTVNPQDIYVRIENPTTGCFTVTLLELQVLPNPSPLTPDEIDAQMGVMQSCVNDGNGEGTLQEGYAIFNLLDYETAILIGQGPQVEPGVTLTYYISESDANLGLNPIADPSNFYNTVPFGQVIWVRAENDETGCYTLTDFDIQVPAIVITATTTTDTLCIDEYGVPLTDVALPILSASATNMTASTSDGIYNYQWSLNGVDIPGATDQTLTVSQAGDYMVTVTGSEQMDFSCINTATVSITASSSPDDYQASVTTNAFANAHQVVATATSSLAGVEFIYTLDTGEENTTGIFNDVTPGPHTITISDAGGCWFDVLDLFVIDYPKFFSPNGDGANDTWMIYGIDGIPISQIYVFDRFGKLLKQLDPDGDGWNGTYNGAEMPSTDYWFKIIYIENNEQKEFRAHFSLKR